MSTDTPSNVELSDDELRVVADEAREWADNGNYVNAPLDPDNPHGYLYMSDQAHCYYTGVIAERKRSRAVHALAMKLAGALQIADQNHDITMDALTAAENRGGWQTRALRDWTVTAMAERDALLDECAAAGLLPSEPRT